MKSNLEKETKRFPTIGYSVYPWLCTIHRGDTTGIDIQISVIALDFFSIKHIVKFTPCFYGGLGVYHY